MLLTGGLDEGVEHGDDGLAENVGDASVDAGVEGLGLTMDKVIHRLGPRRVLPVEKVRTHLTCDFAVPEEHGDVEDGSATEDGERRCARLDLTEVLEGPQFRPSQETVAVAS